MSSSSIYEFDDNGHYALQLMRHLIHCSLPMIIFSGKVDKWREDVEVLRQKIQTNVETLGADLLNGDQFRNSAIFSSCPVDIKDELCTIYDGLYQVETVYEGPFQPGPVPVDPGTFLIDTPGRAALYLGFMSCLGSTLVDSSIQAIQSSDPELSNFQTSLLGTIELAKSVWMSVGHGTVFAIGEYVHPALIAIGGLNVERPQLLDIATCIEVTALDKLISALLPFDSEIAPIIKQWFATTLTNPALGPSLCYPYCLE